MVYLKIFQPKVVLHIDSLGTADPIPFGIDGASPLVIMRVQPLAGDLSRFEVKSTDLSDEGEVLHLQTILIAEKAVHTSEFPLAERVWSS